jgi:hypothetical protein
MKEKIDMKKKIEKILTVVWEDNNSWESEGSKETIKKALDELSTLIQEEREETVRGFITDFIETGVYEGVGSIEDIMKLWRKYNAHN